MKQCTCYALRAIDCTCKPAEYGELYTSPTAKQEQGEPVAWMTETGSVWKTREKNTDIPLYTTPQPAQKPWVGLIDEEKIEIIEKYMPALGLGVMFIDEVEAKLKEKNT